MAFARRCAFAEYRHVSERARARHLAVVEAIKRRDFGDFPPAWADFDLERYWNLDAPYRELFQPGDTVGAVSMSEDGVFAVAASTGGSSPMLRGRVGDTPIIGSGFYAGRHGAVATTGIGEEIVRRMLAREVYQLLADGEAPARGLPRRRSLVSRRPLRGSDRHRARRVRHRFKRPNGQSRRGRITKTTPTQGGLPTHGGMGWTVS